MHTASGIHLTKRKSAVNDKLNIKNVKYNAEQPLRHFECKIHMKTSSNTDSDPEKNTDMPPVDNTCKNSMHLQSQNSQVKASAGFDSIDSFEHEKSGTEYKIQTKTTSTSQFLAKRNSDMPSVEKKGTKMICILSLTTPKVNLVQVLILLIHFNKNKGPVVVLMQKAQIAMLHHCRSKNAQGMKLQSIQVPLSNFLRSKLVICHLTHANMIYFFIRKRYTISLVQMFLSMIHFNWKTVPVPMIHIPLQQCMSKRENVLTLAVQ